MGKLCGYCRNEGHTMPRCEVRNGQVDMLRRHVGSERLRLLQYMQSSGIGNGAIIKAYYWQAGESVPMIITDINETLDAYQNPLWESTNIKYKKSIKLKLVSYTGHFVSGDVQWTNIHQTGGFYVTARPLCNPNEKLSCFFRVSSLIDSPASKMSLHYYSWDRQSELIAPSSDGDIDMGKVQASFRLPDRLGRVMATPILP